MRFDEDTQTWVKDTVTPQIAEIENQIKEIEDEQAINDKEFENYQAMLVRTKNLIAEIQSSC